MRILALDIGEKRTGAAVSDPLGITAQPLDTIESATPEAREDKVLLLIRKVQPDKVIVGLPRNMDGTLGPQARMALDLAERIREKSGIPVDTWDERLTTVEAENILRSADVRRKKRKRVKDALAAVLILEGYLDHLKSQNPPLLMAPDRSKRSPPFSKGGEGGD